MPNLRISELPAAAALVGDELVELVQDGVNVQSTAQAVADLGGGGGGLLFSDFTQTEIPGNVSTPVIVTTYTLPAGTIPVNGQLLIESYFSYDQDDPAISDDYGIFDISILVGGWTVGQLFAPNNRGDSGYRATGFVRIESRVQAINSSVVQYNSGLVYEVCENNTDGLVQTITGFIPGQYPPTTGNVTAIDLAANADVVVRVTNGTGESTSKLIHRYTKVSSVS